MHYKKLVYIRYAEVTLCGHRVVMYCLTTVWFTCWCVHTTYFVHVLHVFTCAKCIKLQADYTTESLH